MSFFQRTGEARGTEESEGRCVKVKKREEGERDFSKRRRCVEAKKMCEGERDDIWRKEEKKGQPRRERVLPYISLTRQVVSTQVMPVELVRVECELFLDWGFFFHRPYVGLVGEENELWVDFFFCGTLAGRQGTLPDLTGCVAPAV